MILSMSQMNLIVGSLSYPTQTLLGHLLKSMTDLKTNCQYFKIDHPLASVLVVSLSNQPLQESAVAAVVQLPNLPSLWGVTVICIKKDANPLMHCLLAPRAAADINLCASHAG